ncbi:MAG: YciC family protein [Nitrospirota bacterium]|nr:YciC family protein [Nitrospirota bacterium]
MGVGDILKESLGLTRKHTIVIVPPVLVSFFIGCLSIVVIGMQMTAMEPDAVGELGKGMTDLILAKSVLSVVGWIFYSFAQGMVASMMVELEDKGETSLGSGFGRANEMIVSLMVAGFVLGVLLLLGFMLFIIPGLIVAFVFSFTFVVIMLEKRGPIDAMKRSVQIVRSNLSVTFKLFAAIIGIGFLLMVSSVILSKLSLIGLLASMALTGAYMGYTYVVFIKTYQKFKEEGAGFPRG